MVEGDFFVFMSLCLMSGGLRPMAAGRLKSDSHMQAPHRGAQLAVTASHPPHIGRVAVKHLSHCCQTIQRKITR